MIDPNIIAALFHWAVLLSGYPAPNTPPEVTYVPHSFLVEHACNQSACSVIGWTTPDKRVYIDDSLVLDDTFASSVVVHEFVHFLQFYNDANPLDRSCIKFVKFEREAYTVQQQYLIRYGDYIPLTFNLMDVSCN